MAKIMLVEDDNNLREIYEARLLAEGYEIVSAHDGEEALALAVKEKPDLIISDVMMPKISGFDMLDILRGTPETKNTKVIMMTALSQVEDKDRADKLGADRYLVKSQVTLEDVARVAREVLENREVVEPAAPTEPLAGVPDQMKSAPVAAPQAAEPPAASDTPVTAPVTNDEPAAATAASDDSTPEPVAATTSASSDEPSEEADEATEPQPTAPEEPAPTPVVSEPADEKPITTPSESLPVTPEAPEEAPSAETSDESSPAEPSATDGPVQQILAAPTAASEQETVEEQVKDFENHVNPAPPLEAAESTPSSAVDVSVSSMPSSEPATAESDPITNTTPPSGKKVIQPLNDPTTTPDLNALLAKEEAAQASTSPAAGDTVEAAPTDTAEDNDKPPSGQDPNLIAL